MRKLIIAIVVVLSLALAGTAGAALVPGVFDPGNTGCPKATVSHGWLHLEKNCATTTNAAAGADITGLEGQPFVSASFTLKSASQCQGGSPRFDISTTGGLWFAGCNTVTPVIDAKGRATYTFTPANLVPQAPGNTLGTITAVDVLIDVQGTADLRNITVNGVKQKVAKGDRKLDHGNDDEHGHHGHHDHGDHGKKHDNDD